MTKEMKELLLKIKALKSEASDLIKEDKLDAAEEKTKEIDKLQKKYELLEKVHIEEQENITELTPEEKKKITCGFSLMAKAVTKGLTSKEAEPLLDSNALITGGENGENYLVPVDVKNFINERKRQYKSAKQFCTVIPAQTLSGSEVYEDTSTYVGLDAFDDGDDVPRRGAPKFVNLPWALKQYGKLIPLSNRLLSTEKGRIEAYIDRWFTRNAVITENRLIFQCWMANKTAKPLTNGWKDLRSSINKDLDPDVLIGAVIITNQNGFDYLDSQEDENGKPILQPDPTQPTRMLFKGLPVEEFSNALLPDIEDDLGNFSSPVFYGNMSLGSSFYELEMLKFASSDHVFFGKNQKALRIIEDIDVIQTDKYAYHVGLLPSEAPTPDEEPEPDPDPIGQ